ncbi:MAG TPA: CBS domain-containing protein [Paracoccaceae bacterium]|nr:CBS domain-containing protein [Paracoccaceae bacterium]
MVTVRRIIRDKPLQKVITIRPDATVAEAATVLAENRIGAVIVSRDDAIVDGILSERDIVRCLATAGAEVLDKPVSELMTPEVIACLPDDTALDVLEKMTDRRFRHMPVVEDGRMIGVISIGDAVKARMDEIEHEKDALTGMIANTW